VQEADVVLLLVDARAGLLPDDQWIINTLRSRSKAFYLVVNKVDGTDYDQAMAEFYATGSEHLFPVTATHGRGVKSLLEFVVQQFPQKEEEELPADAGIKIAVVGRPNVGKSTLV